MAGFLGALTPVDQPYNGGTFVPAGTGIFNLPGLNAQSSGWLGIDGLGANLNTLQLGLGGLQSLGGLWNSYQQNKLAKKAFNYQKGIMDTNIANQIKDYNLGIEDKFRSRAVVEGTSDAERDAQIAKWSATDKRKG